MPVDIFRVRWDAEVAGTSYLMVVVVGEWPTDEFVGEPLCKDHTSSCFLRDCVAIALSKVAPTAVLV